jgi:hypothetical protein
MHVALFFKSSRKSKHVLLDSGFRRWSASRKGALSSALFRRVEVPLALK